jgi:hypothetical protein
MTDDPFTPATREAVKARIALTGPAGSGKTYTALAIGTELHDRVAVIDTEHGRALDYADRFTFAHFAPSRFDPRELCTLLARAAEHKYGVVVIDSLSHYWMGAGGALEIVDNAAASARGNGMAGWKEFRPIEARMIDALLGYPGHVIVTMRVKTSYVIEQDDRGKNVPRKVGLKPDQREGVDYEFGLIGEMDREHTMTVTKSTCPALVDERIPKPGADVAMALKTWISGGVNLPDALEYRDDALKPDVTAQELRRMFNEVKNRRLLGAMVVDDHGDEVALGDLIRRVGEERTKAAPV